MKETAEFHIQLLLQVIDMEPYPFIKMVIEKGITEEEYLELMKMVRELNDTYKKQKKEGLVHYSPLLVHFAGMLNEKLHPTEVIYALKKEGYYPSLMDEFIRIMNDQNPIRRHK